MLRRFLVPSVALSAVLVVSSCVSVQEPESAPTSAIGQPLFAVSMSQTLTGVIAQQRLGPLTASRVYGYTYAAAHEAYQVNGSLADAATAADLVASELLFHTPQPRAQLDTLRRRYAVDGPTDAGVEVAQRWITRLHRDGHAESHNVPAPAEDQGRYGWSSTGMARAPFMDPGYGEVQPLFAASATCDIPPPDTARMERDARAMFDNFDVASASDEYVLLFLAGVATPTPPGQMLQMAANLVEANGLDDADALSVLAAVSVAGYDTGIITWREKREHMMARPETLYERITGKPVLLARETPNHPSYPSGHSAFSGSAAQIFEESGLGSNHQLLLVLPPDLAAPRAEYRFNSPAEMTAAVNRSRVDARFHYPADTAAGEQLGRCIGRVVYAEYLSEFELTPVAGTGAPTTNRATGTTPPSQGTSAPNTPTSPAKGR